MRNRGGLDHIFDIGGRYHWFRDRARDLFNVYDVIKSSPACKTQKSEEKPESDDIRRVISKMEEIKTKGQNNIRRELMNSEWYRQWKNLWPSLNIDLLKQQNEGTLSIDSIDSTIQIFTREINCDVFVGLHSKHKATQENKTLKYRERIVKQVVRISRNLDAYSEEDQAYSIDTMAGDEQRMKKVSAYRNGILESIEDIFELESISESSSPYTQPLSSDFKDPVEVKHDEKFREYNGIETVEKEIQEEEIEEEKIEAFEFSVPEKPKRELEPGKQSSEDFIEEKLLTKQSGTPISTRDESVEKIPLYDDDAKKSKLRTFWRETTTDDGLTLRYPRAKVNLLTDDLKREGAISGQTGCDYKLTDSEDASAKDAEEKYMRFMKNCLDMKMDEESFEDFKQSYHKRCANQIKYIWDGETTEPQRLYAFRVRTRNHYIWMNIQEMHTFSEQLVNIIVKLNKIKEDNIDKVEDCTEEGSWIYYFQGNVDEFYEITKYLRIAGSCHMTYDAMSFMALYPVESMTEDVVLDQAPKNLKIVKETIQSRIDQYKQRKEDSIKYEKKLFDGYVKFIETITRDDQLGKEVTPLLIRKIQESAAGERHRTYNEDEKKFEEEEQNKYDERVEKETAYGIIESARPQPRLALIEDLESPVNNLSEIPERRSEHSTSENNISRWRLCGIRTFEDVKCPLSDTMQDLIQSFVIQLRVFMNDCIQSMTEKMKIMSGLNEKEFGLWKYYAKLVEWDRDTFMSEFQYNTLSRLSKIKPDTLKKYNDNKFSGSPKVSVPTILRGYSNCIYSNEDIQKISDCKKAEGHKTVAAEASEKVQGFTFVISTLGKLAEMKRQMGDMNIFQFNDRSTRTTRMKYETVTVHFRSIPRHLRLNGSPSDDDTQTQQIFKIPYLVRDSGEIQYNPVHKKFDTQRQQLKHIYLPSEYKDGKILIRFASWILLFLKVFPSDDDDTEIFARSKRAHNELIKLKKLRKRIVAEAYLWLYYKMYRTYYYNIYNKFYGNSRDYETMFQSLDFENFEFEFIDKLKKLKLKLQVCSQVDHEVKEIIIDEKCKIEIDKPLGDMIITFKGTIGQNFIDDQNVYSYTAYPPCGATIEDQGKLFEIHEYIDGEVPRDLLERTLRSIGEKDYHGWSFVPVNPTFEVNKYGMIAFNINTQIQKIMYYKGDRRGFLKSQNSCPIQPIFVKEGFRKERFRNGNNTEYCTRRLDILVADIEEKRHQLKQQELQQLDNERDKDLLVKLKTKNLDDITFHDLDDIQQEEDTTADVEEHKSKLVNVQAAIYHENKDEEQGKIFNFSTLQAEDYDCFLQPAGVVKVQDKEKPKESLTLKVTDDGPSSTSEAINETTLLVKDNHGKQSLGTLRRKDDDLTITLNSQLNVQQPLYLYRIVLLEHIDEIEGERGGST